MGKALYPEGKGRTSILFAGDILEALKLRESDHVAMIGSFGPLIAPLRKRAASLSIFDRRARPGAKPAHEAFEDLAKSDVAIISATTLIDGSITPLLDAASDCREVALLGA